VAVVFCALDAGAVDPTVTFSLPNPGARSMALGGAFVAQADDATAAYANPAGLVQLLDPEISIEGRVWLYSSDRDEGFGGDDGTIKDLSGVGFLSGVYPVRRFSLALYRNQLAKFEVNPDLESWYGDIWDVGAFEIVTWGVAGAYRITESLSIGAGLAYHEGEVETLQQGVTSRAESDGWGVNAGVLWKPNPSFNFGGFYRQGAELDVSESRAATLADASPLGVPDVFGVGAAYRTSGGSFALLAEWDHVRHSSLGGRVADGTVVEFDDADEIHLGAEYAFLWAEPVIAIRLGAWYDPAHRWLVEQGERSQIDRDEFHASGGLGVAWTHFQLDFALDVSDPVVTLSISGIFSF
jgi:hypothetical protein